jgi:hypothetical protein
MRKIGIIAVLSLMALALAAVPALAANSITILPSAAPTGTHLQSGTLDANTCFINTTGGVTCNSYELAGVGNANAQADLSTTFTATVDCRNNGGKIVPVKASVQTVPSSTGQLEPKNGRLAVPSLSSGAAPTAAQFEALATCPNGNWDKITQTSTIALSSFTYTLHFVGFTGNYVTITGP